MRGLARIAALGLCWIATPALSQMPDEILPPVMAWNGASTHLVAAPDDPWITPAEQAGFNLTPDYAATLA